MRILVTGASGFVGSALVPHLIASGHEVRAFARSERRVREAGLHDIDVALGDALTGAGLDAALEGIDCAYYLIHSMEPVADGAGFDSRDRDGALAFAAAAQRQGVQRVIYLGGLVPADAPASAHLASRLEVERILLDAAPSAIALRASIVIGARSRSFRVIVRLVERLRVLPLPAWRDHRTQPIDGRDVIAYLEAAATSEHGAGGLSVDIAGLDVVTYAGLIDAIRERLLVRRAALRLGFAATPIASAVVAAITGESQELVGPLMAGLEHDLLPRDERALELFDVRRHTLGSAIHHALREWESSEELAAR